MVRRDAPLEIFGLALELQHVGGLEEGRGVCRCVEAHARNLRRGPEAQCRVHCRGGRREERPRHDRAQRRDRLASSLLERHDRVGPASEKRLTRWCLGTMGLAWSLALDTIRRWEGSVAFSLDPLLTAADLVLLARSVSWEVVFGYLFGY